MRNMKKVTVMALLLAVSGLAVLYIQELGRVKLESQFRPLTMRYSIQIRNTGNKALKDAKVAVFAPLDMPQQRVVVLETQPTRYSASPEAEGFNNITFDFDLIPPFGEKNVIVTAQLQVLPEPHDQAVLYPDAYLGDGEYLKLQSAELQTVLKDIQPEASQQLPKQVYDWVLQNIQYSGYVQEDRGALYALKTRKGDCTEYMYLMMALLRASGIPARGLAGFYVEKQESMVSAAGYHNWVEYYDGEVWRILDPLNNRFDEGYGHYVVLREISVDNENNGLSSQRFVSHDSRLVVSMR